MRLFRPMLVLLILALATSWTAGVVHAIPALPSGFYGTVKNNGQNVPEGTPIQVSINGQVVGESPTMMYEGVSVYSIDVKGDDPDTQVIDGGKDGDSIQFIVGGVAANETGVWRSGTNTEQNLTLSSSATLEPPKPTLTPIPTQTRIGSVKQDSAGNQNPTATTDTLIDIASGEVSTATQSSQDNEIITNSTTSNQDPQSLTADERLTPPEDERIETNGEPIDSIRSWKPILYSGLGISVIAAATWFIIRKRIIK